MSGIRTKPCDIVRACSFTGHRPAGFTFGHDESHPQFLKIKALLEERVALLAGNGVATFYSGMASGVDQWCAEIVLELKKTNPDIRLIAVRPCETQADRWNEEQRERHYNTLALCDDVITLYKKYTKSCMYERNRFLVDNAQYVLAVYDGGSKGGTAYTIGYAKKLRRWVTVIDSNNLSVT